MSKPTPEIRTFFSLRGLTGARALLRKFGDAVQRMAGGIAAASRAAARAFLTGFQSASRGSGRSVDTFGRKFDRMSAAVVRGAVKAGLALVGAFGSATRAAIRATIRALEKLLAILLAVAAAMRRAFGAAVKTSILTTAAALRRVTSELHRVTRAATAAGAKMALVGAGILAVLTAISVAAKATAVAVAGVAGLAAGALVGGGSVALATVTATDQAKRSETAGTSAGGVLGVQGAAGQLGVEAEEAEGWLASLRGKLKDAANGGEAAAFFGKLRVAATDATGGVQDSVAALADLDRATASMSTKDRRSAFADLFGDDADSVIAFLEKGGIRRIDAARKRAEGFGAVVSAADVAMARDFKSAIQDLLLSIKGMALEISRRILPGITAMTRGLSDFISANRTIFADRFAAGWGRIMESMGGAVGILRIIPASAGVVVRSMHELLGVFSDIGKYLAGDFGGIERTWVYELTRAVHATINVFSTLADLAGGGLVTALSRGWVGFLNIVTQIVAAFMGLDHVVRQGWILLLRDGMMAIVAAVRQIPAFVEALPGYFETAKTAALQTMEALRVAAVEALIAALTVAMSVADGVMAAIESRVAAFYARAAAVMKPYIDAARDIFEVLRDGENAKTESPWIAEIRPQLISARQLALDFWESLKTAWGWFRSVLDVIHAVIKPILDLFGTNILTAALFMGMMRMSGVLTLIGVTVATLTKTVKGCIWAFRVLMGLGGANAAAGVVGAAGAGAAGSGIAGFLSGTIAALTRLATLIPHVATLVAAAYTGYETGKKAGQTFYEKTGMQAADDAALEARFATMRNSLNYVHDQRLASLASLPPPPPTRTGDVLMSDGKTLDMDELWSRTSRPSYDSLDGRFAIDFNVGGGRGRTLTGTRSMVEGLVQDLADARNAGGLR